MFNRKFNKVVFWRVLGFFALLDLLLFSVGCSTAWTTEAINIIELLIPAIQGALAIVGAYGVGIVPTALADVNKWSGLAVSDLNLVKTLIDDYNAATAGERPDILSKIDAAVETAKDNLNSILPALNITDPKTKAEITAIYDTVYNEIEALLNLIPAIQGKVSSHAHLKQLVAAVRTADEFKKEYNSKVAVFGSTYELK